MVTLLGRFRPLYKHHPLLTQFCQIHILYSGQLVIKFWLRQLSNTYIICFAQFCEVPNLGQHSQWILLDKVWKWLSPSSLDRQVNCAMPKSDKCVVILLSKMILLGFISECTTWTKFFRYCWALYHNAPLEQNNSDEDILWYVLSMHICTLA